MILGIDSCEDGAEDTVWTYLGDERPHLHNNVPKSHVSILLTQWDINDTYV